MKKSISIAIGILVGCFLIVLSFALWPTSTAEITAGQEDLKNPALVEKGRYLATLGDCAACHTQSGSADYSGGDAIESPIGAMYSPNITPDKQYGIGEYTLNDFSRAMRNGIRKDGVTLYPAMPYPSFSRLSDDDIKALYAYFLHGVKPAAVPNKSNEIVWPLSIRWPVAIWRKLYAPDIVQFDPSQYLDEKMARGAYLVEGLGHCGTCHTPRAITLQEKGLDEKTATYLAGGQLIDGWFAPSLRADADGLKYWTEDDIVQTLRNGRNTQHVIIGQPMNDVVIKSSSHWTDDDLKSVAAYLKSLQPLNQEPVVAVSQQKNRSIEETANLAFQYQTSCSACHGRTGLGKDHVFPALVGNNTVLAANPQSLIRLVLDGYDVPPFNQDLLPMRMPNFRDRLSDENIADILTYIRDSWGNQAPAVTAAEVKKLRN